MGRPKKYTERTLRKAVEAYFDSITREVAMTEKVDTGRKDADGHKIFENVPVINKRGEQVKITEYLVPPTVGGLCEALGIHRSTWAEYCDENTHPEFSDTTTRTPGAHARVPGAGVTDPQGREGHYLLPAEQLRLHRAAGG